MNARQCFSGRQRDGQGCNRVDAQHLPGHNLINAAQVVPGRQ